MIAISQKPCEIQDANQAGIDEAAEDEVEMVTGWSSKDIHSMMVLSYITQVASVVVLPRKEQGGTMLVDAQCEDISELRSKQCGNTMTCSDTVEKQVR